MSKDSKSGHYDVGAIEALDVIKAKLTPDQFEGYLLGNALKYLQRCNHKQSMIRDVEKAINYTCWLKEELLGENDVSEKQGFDDSSDHMTLTQHMRNITSENN